MPQYEKLSLMNINNGAVPELFEEAWKELLEDVANMHKPAQAARSVTIEIKVKPNKERGHVAIAVGVKTKLPPADPFGGFAHLSLDGDKVNSFVNNPKQNVLEYETQGESQEENA